VAQILRDDHAVSGAEPDAVAGLVFQRHEKAVGRARYHRPVGQALHRHRAGAAPDHGVEIAHRAAERAAVHGQGRIEAQRRRGGVEFGVKVFPDKRKPAVEHGKHAFDARKGRERPGLFDRGHAQAPDKIVHARARREDGDLARCPPPFFHAMARIWAMGITFGLTRGCRAGPAPFRARNRARWDSPHRHGA
jgi:hypothetical protein